MKLIISKQYSIFILILFALSCPVSVSMAAINDYIVSANILVGSCTVSVTPDTLPMAGVAIYSLRKGKLLDVTPLNLTLKCTGSGNEGTPTLLITGNTLSTTGNGRYLFRSPDSAITGAGFVLSKNDMSDWKSEQFLMNNGSLPIDNPGTSYKGGAVPLFVGVGCGSAQDCIKNVGPDDYGSLKAEIRFSFAYK